MSEIRPESFSSETDLLRLSNYKAKKFLNWHPKWELNKSIDKILEWNSVENKNNALKICQIQIKEFLEN